MRQQLVHLTKEAARPNVTLRVIPEAVGAHPGLSGHFGILEFQGAGPVVYLEHLTGDVFLHDAHDVEKFRITFGRLAQVALDPDESVRMIARLIEGNGRD